MDLTKQAIIDAYGESLTEAELEAFINAPMEELTDEEKKAFIDATVEGLKESISYFGNKRKPERERWVCKEFLMNIQVRFDDADIKSSQVDPPDVDFEEASFEIKELLDPKRRRHDEYKTALEKAQNATEPEELLEMFSPRDLTPGEVFELVRDHLVSLGPKYLAERRHSIDMLYYVNLRHRTFLPGELPDLSELKGLGWRSVSALVHRTSLIFHVADSAPKFLREAGVGVVVRPDAM